MATPTMRRRRLLACVARGGAVALVAYVFGPAAAAPASAAPAGLPLSRASFGASRESRALVDLSLGDAARDVLIVGGIHAGDEANTVTLVQQLVAAFQADASLVPSGLRLTIVPSANPDGLAAGTRMLASGVDPNRNWPTDDWARDTYIAGMTGPTLVPGGGGPGPWSEPETRSLGDLVARLHPALIVSYHSSGGMVTGGPLARAIGLEATYAAVSGYTASDFLAYPVTGDFLQWAEERQHIPTLDIELPDYVYSYPEANLAALRATLVRLASVTRPG